MAQCVSHPQRLTGLPVYGPTDDQEAVFSGIAPYVRSCMDGYNVSEQKLGPTMSLIKACRFASLPAAKQGQARRTRWKVGEGTIKA
jgi:hypothetical protein